MGLINDAFDETDILMTEKEKGPKAAEAKKKEVQKKHQQSEEAASN